MHEGAPREPLYRYCQRHQTEQPPVHRARSVGRSAVHCGQVGEAHFKYRNRGAEPVAAGCFWGCYSTPLAGPIAHLAPASWQWPERMGRACWMNPHFGMPASI